MAAWPGWEKDVLSALGYPTTAANEQFLDTWQHYEGGGATDNPLNTTQPESGASNYNTVGVKNYTSQTQGTQATVTTLRNGHYPALLAAMQTGDPYTYIDPNGVAANIRTWGTGNFATSYLLSAGSFSGQGGTPPPAIKTDTSQYRPSYSFNGYADLRNSVARHIPTQLRRSQRNGEIALRLLSAKTKVAGRKR